MSCNFQTLSSLYKHTYLIFSQAKARANASIACLKNVSRRTIDVLAFKLYSYYSYAHEVTNGLSEICG
jgi:26S proteasome regulatory subunit N3